VPRAACPPVRKLAQAISPGTHLLRVRSVSNPGDPPRLPHCFPGRAARDVGTALRTIFEALPSLGTPPRPSGPTSSTAPPFLRFTPEHGRPQRLRLDIFTGERGPTRAPAIQTPRNAKRLLKARFPCASTTVP
jgi:hypothetical protein